MTNTYLLGTTLIDTRDGRPCIVSAVADGRVTHVRKRIVGSKRWRTYQFEAERYMRPSAVARRAAMRMTMIQRHGPDVVRLAESLGLPCGEVKKARA